MKQLTDSDIAKMAETAFTPDFKSVNKSVRAQLRLGTLIPLTPGPLPKCVRLDLHTLTEQQAWDAIMDVAMSGVRDAVIITGASGILHELFQKWVTNSILAPYVVSWTPINNGSFSVKFKRLS